MSADTWQIQAACRSVDPELFTPLAPGETKNPATSSRIRQAIKICARCPVTAECLAEAIANAERGVWGGTYHTGMRHPVR